MAKRYSWETDAPAPGRYSWDSPAAAPERKPVSVLAALGSGAADGFSMGFGDELMGLISGGGAALSGGDFDRAYADAVAASRDRQYAARTDQGGWYTGGQVGGAILPFIGPGMLARGGAALVGRGVTGALAKKAAMSAARRFAMPGVNAAERLAMGGGVMRRILSGMAIGAPYGALAGAGHADGYDMGDAVGGGIAGAGMGAAFGGAIPAISGGLGALMQSLKPTVSRVAAPVVEDGVFMSAGSPPGPNRPPGSPGPSDLEIEETALDKFLRLVGNSRKTLDDLENATNANMRYDPGRGRTFVDDIGVGAEKTLKFLNKGTGQTAGLADEVLSARNRDTYGRIEKEFDDIIPGPERGMMGRRADARAEFERLRENEFKTIWSQDAIRAPRTMRGAQNAIDYLTSTNDPLVRAGLARANTIWTRPQLAEGLADASAGAPPPLRALEGDPVRQLHYIKRGIDEEVAYRSDPLNANKLTEEEEATARLLRGSIRRVLDDLIPGYRSANQKFGDESSAIYAMGFGRKLMRGRFNPRLFEEFQEMTPFERQSAIVGIKDDILETLRTSDKEGRRNIADTLNSTETLRRMETLLGKDNAERIKHLLSTESRLHRTASYAGARSGSDTGIFGAEMLDDLANVQKPNGPVDAAWQFGRQFLDDIASGVTERRRDAIGRLLLQNTDDPYTREQVKALYKLLRDRQAARADNAHGLTSGGAQGGYGYGTWQDM